MRTAMRTDIGCIRTVNEDRVMVETGADGLTLAIVADGMGGHQAGDIASQIAVDTIHEQLRDLLVPGSTKDREMAIKEAVYHANSKVYTVASSLDHYHGMGTTVVVALADHDSIVLGHIGDSRAYRWDGQRVEQLTDDHSLVNELLKSGQISKEEAGQHPRRNVLTRALGTEPFVEVEVANHKWRRNDILLLCTDGLSSLVDTEQMERVMRDGDDLDKMADRLVEIALNAGGEDNITVILLANSDAVQAGNGVD